MPEAVRSVRVSTWTNGSQRGLATRLQRKLRSSLLVLEERHGGPRWRQGRVCVRSVLVAGLSSMAVVLFAACGSDRTSTVATTPATVPAQALGVDDDGVPHAA